MSFYIKVFCLSLGLPFFQASEAFDKSSYLNGKQICESFIPNYEQEHGEWIDSLVDHENPSKGSFKIYSYFLKPFNPILPTALIFPGGPGQNSHIFRINSELFRSLNFNILLFDYRGVACSRPESITQYLSPKFYSSYQIANDVELIRKHYKIKKLSIYGISYGTIPATIYASLFPESTLSLTLEGTAFNAKYIIEADSRRKIVQLFFNKLPPRLQNLVLELSQNADLNPQWFFEEASQFLYRNQGLDEFKLRLIELTNSPDPVGELLSQYSRRNEARPINAFAGAYFSLYKPEEIFFQIIYCKELGAYQKNLPESYIFENKKLVPIKSDSSFDKCKLRGIKSTEISFYVASFFPVEVATTYFQGGLDGATLPVNMTSHWREVPQNFAQLLIMPDAGHNPNLSALTVRRNHLKTHQLQSSIFKLALLGKAIPADLITEFNKSSELKWKYTNRN